MSATTVKTRRREVRRALGEDAATTLEAVLAHQGEQDEAILRLVRALEAFVTQGLWSRLRWIVRGR